MSSAEGSPLYWLIDGHQIEIKYPGKLYWPEEGITKLELVSYYKEVAGVMFPYVEGRPVTLHYFPRGIDKVSFYKRDYSKAIPGLIDTFPYQEISQNKVINVPVIAGKAGIVYLASKGCIEFHSWASVTGDIYRPTWAVFDLDIQDMFFFPKVLEAAYLLYKHLKKEGLFAYAKTSGGKGLHVYVPVKPIYDFKQIRNWVAQTGVDLQKRYPAVFALPAKGNKTHDTNKVVIDYRQNTITRNTASVYSVRAKPGATVSAPLSWQEVINAKVKPDDFTLKTMPERLKTTGDIFKNVLELKQLIPGL